MEGINPIYWESADFSSDIDNSWSPGSSHYSDQENYPAQQQQQQQQQQANVNYYLQPGGQQDLMATALADSFGTYTCDPQQQQQQTDDILQSCTLQDQLTAAQNATISPNSSTSSSSSSSSSSPRKSKNPVKRVHQRNAANMRERRRMKTINDAFEGLRERIPLASGDRKLSKVDTLRLAIRYIHQLNDLVSTTGSPGSQTGREQEAAKVIIRYHNGGAYPDPYMDGVYQEQYPLYGHSLSWQGHKPIGMTCHENKMAAKVWTPQIASSHELEEMASYVS